LIVNPDAGNARPCAASDKPPATAMNCRLVSDPIKDKLDHWEQPGSDRGIAVGNRFRDRQPEFPCVVVYRSDVMRSWVEGVLAIIIVVALGAVLFLFAGESVDDATSDAVAPIDFDADSAARGQVLAETKGCLQCHTVDGTPGSGPTWKGVAGSSRPLASGESVIADDTYLLNSIVDPSFQIVEGFDAIMSPDYGETLNSGEITDLINFIKSLSS
jgi:cytochrome c1